MSAASRRARRARRRRPGRDDRALRFAVELLHLWGPVAARNGRLIALKPAHGSAPTEVLALCRETGATCCLGCGTELDPAIVGSSVINRAVLARDPKAPAVVMRFCEACAELAGGTATRSASA